ncbi:MAG: phosphate ABC transporter substrate-binding/OmpA family protein [Pseudomonadota bacterium]
MVKDHWLRGQSAVALALVMGTSAGAPSAVTAQSVVLTNTDTGLVLEGKMTSFEDGVFTVATTFGNFEINGDMVECSGTGCPIGHASAFDFHISGSPAIGSSLMPLLIEGFAVMNDGKVDVSTGPNDVGLRYDAFAGDNSQTELFRAQLEDNSSADGFRALIEGRAHFAMAAGEADLDNVTDARAAGLGDLNDFSQEYGVALEALSLVTHPENPVDTITTDQLIDVLTGRVDNWRDLGGPDAPIELVSADEGDGSYAQVAAQLLSPAAPPRLTSKITETSQKAAVETVLDAPGSLGIVRLGAADGMAQMQLHSTCNLPYAQGAFGAKAGENPLSRTMYLYSSNQDLPPKAAAFLDYATSPQASNLVEVSGFVDFSVSAKMQEAAATRVRMALRDEQSIVRQDRMRELFIDMIEWERLSTTFRFSSSSPSLNNAALRDIPRLAEHLDGLPAGTEVAFVGFTDSSGSFTSNVNLSRERANAVEEQLIALAGDAALTDKDVVIKGYGELNPVGCNDTEKGKQLNRRVEVWIRSE